MTNCLFNQESNDMGLYNFQERFVPFIQDGSKTHTIRAIRKHPQKVGALMHLFYGLRTKWAKRIITATPCKKVQTIFIMPTGRIYLVDEILTETECLEFIKNITVNNRFLSNTERNELAWRDGFRVDDNGTREGCFELMMRWWKQTHELPFYGHIQYWNE